MSTGGTADRSGPAGRLFAALKGRAQSSEGRERLYPTVALAFVVLLAAWMGSFDGGYFVGGWAPPTIALAVTALLVAAVAPFRGMDLRWSVLALGLLTAYTTWTLASVLWASNKGDAWVGTGQTYLYLLAFLVAVALVTLGASRRWVLAASVLGPGIIAALTLLNLPSRINDYFHDDRLIGTVGYYNGEAAFLLVPFWISLYVAGSRRINPVLRSLVLAAATVNLNLAVLTQSRGAMVALAVSLLVFFVFSGKRLRGFLALLPVAAALLVAFPGLNDVYLTMSEGGDGRAALESVLSTVWIGACATGLYGLIWGFLDARWRPGRRLARVFGGAVLAAVIVFSTIGATVVFERVGDPVAEVGQRWEALKTNDTTSEDPQSRYLNASVTGRLEPWRVAREDFSSHPILGVGAYNWEATYYELRERRAGFARQPHSLPLEVLAERGIVGGVLFFGFLGVCVASGLWQRFTRFHSEGKAQAGALVAAVAYWFVHSSVEWFWQIPAVTMPAIIFLALLVAPWRHESGPVPLRWPLRVGGIGLAALALVVVIPLYVADRGLERSFQTKDPDRALAEVEGAQRYNPLDPRLARREAEVAEASGDWDRAEDAYKRAIELNPDHYATYAVLAESYMVRGRIDEALRYYDKAIALNPLEYELKQARKQLIDMQDRLN